MWLAGSGLLGGGPTGEGVGKSVALAVARHDGRIALSLRLLWHGLVETAEGAEVMVEKVHGGPVSWELKPHPILVFKASINNSLHHPHVLWKL